MNIPLLIAKMNIPIYQNKDYPNHKREENNQIVINMEQKELYFNNIQAQIEQKKRMLINKRKELDKYKKENEYLEGVRNDYKKYHDYIIQEKQNQMNAMAMLKSYIDDLIINGKLTNTDIENAKNEQQHIFKELNRIKKDLDDLVA
jgi:hypothetical protein